MKTIPYFGKNEKFLLLENSSTKAEVVISEEDLAAYFMPLVEGMSTQDKLSLYRSLFRGRQDVYAKSFVNQEGRLQYYPSYTYGWRQLPPEKRQTEPLTELVLKSHLRGETSIGIFPVQSNDSCWFLAMDFDGKDWRQAVKTVRQLASVEGFQASVEISRSGQGAHVWFFFDQETSCARARKFGKHLLELAMQTTKTISFSSFDRLFPNQDFLPKGGFGNLIALPLQGQDYPKGRRVFVDEDFLPYPNQWNYLATVQKISPMQLDEFLGKDLPVAQVTDQLTLTLSNELIFDKKTLSAKTLHYLKKKASFSNPEYYLKRRLRQPIYQVPERIYLFRETDDQLFLPRGLLDDLMADQPGLTVIDQRTSFLPLNMIFKGQLRFDQEAALSDLSVHDNGFLSAPTGFGKTVLASALIAKKQCRTLILVHNKQLFKQWLNRLESFLQIDEEPVCRFTPTGRTKVIGTIGQFTSGKHWRTKLVDVAMIQSLSKLEHPEQVLNDYEMVLVDECHHVTALLFEAVVSKFSGRYLYGLTATPERKNGHQPILYQRIGPQRHQAIEQMDSFAKQLNIKITSFGLLDESLIQSRDFVAICSKLIADDQRNELICHDVVASYQAGRHILVLSNRVEHLTSLSRLLIVQGLEKIYLITGQTKPKEQKELLTQLEKEQSAFVLLSTGQYIGEGFDLPQLDTLFLATPLSWKNNLIQYAGRIHRTVAGKSRVAIYDYLDLHVPYLERMFQRRQLAYKTMAYQIVSESQQSLLYDSQTYLEAFKSDLGNAKKKIELSQNRLSTNLLSAFCQAYPQLSIVCYTSSQLDKKLSSYPNLTIKVCSEKSLPNLVVMDRKLVWFGNFPYLTGRSDEEAAYLRLAGNKLLDEIGDSLDSF